MSNISFFKGQSSRFLGSMAIRADQIAERLGAKVDPKEGFENDVCIYIKHTPAEIISEKTYIDIIDFHPQLIAWMKENPSAKVISVSNMAKEYLANELKRDDIIFLPQHHCNYLRETRQDKEVKVAGIIGSRRACEYDIERLREEIEEIGMELLCNYYPKSRESVVDFYKNIDIQIAYRPIRASKIKGRLFSSLKIANACSFGIPTVAFPEAVFIDEFDCCFIPASSPSELISGIKRLKENRQLYEELSVTGKQESEKYHIDHIKELYEKL